MKNKILIVEDNVVNTAILITMVERVLKKLDLHEKFQIITAHNYSAAMAECLTAKIIILDNELSDVKGRGVDLLSYIRSQPQSDDIFIIGNSSMPRSFSGLPVDANLSSKNSAELAAFLEEFLYL